MTYKEKWEFEHPGDAFSYYRGCPIDNNGTELNCVSDGDCVKCWDQDIPDATEITDACVAEDGYSPTIKDSGDRTEFATGAVRDMREGKGRCDLMPLKVAAQLLGGRDDRMSFDSVLDDIYLFQLTENTEHLYYALDTFAKVSWKNNTTMLLEVAKHFEEGAKKYGESNWQKGIPTYCYIDSAIRHYLKWLRGDKDEPHDRAFVWNIMCCIWEVDYRPKENKEAK